MSWRRRWSRGLLAAGSVSCLAVVGLSWSLIRLLTLDPLPKAQPATQEKTMPVLAVRRGTPVELALIAVEADPFHAERRRPAVAFRLPGEGVPEAPVATQPQTPVLALIGTALLPEGRSFAMCRLGTDPPKVVRVGEQVGGFTLKAVTQGRAVFLTAQGGTLEVGVPKAGS